jgi:hypothetical protein
MKKSLLFVAFGILLILAGLHYAGSIFYLYWDMRWFDSLAHFLGGAGIGFLFLWIWYDSGLFGRSAPSKKAVFLTALISAMIVGIGWEFFEYVNGVANPIAGNYPLDTFNDLLADFYGAVFAGIIGANKKFYE